MVYSAGRRAARSSGGWSTGRRRSCPSPASGCTPSPGTAPTGGSRASQGPERAGVPEALADAGPDVPRRARRADRRRRGAHRAPDDLLRAGGHRADARDHPRPDRRLRQRRHAATWSTSVGRHDSTRSSATPSELNDLATYKQLTPARRSAATGSARSCTAGYGATDALQRMHDEAIESRTRLQLERATEQQAQELEDAKIERELARSSRRREEAAAQVGHELATARRRQEAELADAAIRRASTAASASGTRPSVSARRSRGIARSGSTSRRSARQASTSRSS